MRWRKPKLVSERLAAGALEENKLKQAAADFLRKLPLQFDAIGMAGERCSVL